MISAFISHSTRDRAFVEQQLIPFLEDLGITPWYAAENITVAAAWERGIREALLRSDWVVVVLSPNALQSEWVRSETHWALENKRGRVIPVKLAPCDPSELHIKLVGIQYADFSTDAVAARHRLEALFGRTPSPTTDKERRGNGGTDWPALKTDLPRELDAVLEELAARGKYQVLNLLARTGSGYTLLARHILLKYEVILKSYWMHSADSDQVSALARQIQQRSRLRHPVLVTPIEVVPTESALFVVTQHVADAQSLGDLLREEVGRRGSMTPETACQLLRQVTLGLAHAHAMGISHQSLDPSDVLVNADSRVWVAGFERAVIYNYYKKLNIQVQTLRYSSPEMVYDKPLDSATDVYHVGIILCQLLTGVAPLETRVEDVRPSMFDIGSIRPKVVRIKDPRLRELCLRCLQPRKEDRFSNSGELFAAFVSVQEEKPWWRLWT